MRAMEARIARLEASDPGQDKIKLVVRVIVDKGKDPEPKIVAAIARREQEIGCKFERSEVGAIVRVIVRPIRTSQED